MDSVTSISSRQLERYPIYLKLLYQMRTDGFKTITSSILAKELGYSEESVRKDLQAISSSSGKPGKGREIISLINDFEHFLGYKEVTNAILVGVGNLGEAFLKYSGFSNFGLNILMAFDIDEKKVNTTINDKMIYDMDELEEKIKDLHVEIAVLTVTRNAAQEVTDRLMKCGIKAIWNFVPVHLNVNDDVIVENVDLAASLAFLSYKMKENFSEVKKRERE